MQMTRKQPSNVRPDLLISLATVLVTPIAPSPMMMSVSNPMRSIRWVFLKLIFRHTHAVPMTMATSIAMIIYHT